MDDADRAVAQMEVLDAAHLRRPAAAPARTEPGDRCLNCDEPIPPGRLAAVQGAERCVDCQDMWERAMAR